MNERPRYRRLDGAEVFESPIWAIVADVARSQPPLDRFFASYQRVIGRTSFYRSVAKQIPLRKFGTATRIARADAEAWAASLPTVTGDAA